MRHRTGLDQGQCSWWLYNDDVLTEIKDLGELCSSSAYLLFYLRKDIEEVSIVELLKPFRASATSKPLQPLISSIHLDIPANSTSSERGSGNNGDKYAITKYLYRISTAIMQSISKGGWW